MAAGEQLHFNFGLLITPVKMLDRQHWQWRYFHSGSGAPPIAAIAPTGATIVNIHQGDKLNPYINYPFAAADKLSAYIAEAHARQMKVKIYYTIRELSNYAAEFWALRSLGDEVYLAAPASNWPTNSRRIIAAAARARRRFVAARACRRRLCARLAHAAGQWPLRCRDRHRRPVAVAQLLHRGIGLADQERRHRRPVSRRRRLRSRNHEARSQNHAARQAGLSDRLPLGQQFPP